MKTLALSASNVLQFLEYLLHSHAPLSILVLCCGREEFLADLQAARQRAINKTDDAEDEHREMPEDLFVDTIQMLALSSTIRLIYTPSLSHMRAYLSGLTPAQEDSRTEITMTDLRPPTLAVWGLIAMHRSTADFTAQGISRSLSLAIETARLVEHDFTLAEPTVLQPSEQNEQDPLDIHMSLWRVQIPLLSGSVRMEGSRRMVAGQGLEVGTIVQRWCRIMDLNIPKPIAQHPLTTHARE